MSHCCGQFFTVTHSTHDSVNKLIQSYVIVYFANCEFSLLSETKRKVFFIFCNCTHVQGGVQWPVCVEGRVPFFHSHHAVSRRSVFVCERETGGSQVAVRGSVSGMSTAEHHWTTRRLVGLSHQR